MKYYIIKNIYYYIYEIQYNNKPYFYTSSNMHAATVYKTFNEAQEAVKSAMIFFEVDDDRALQIYGIDEHLVSNNNPIAEVRDDTRRIEVDL